MLYQEKYTLAIYHYKRSLAINSQNPVIYCTMANALHKTQEFHEALKALDEVKEHRNIQLKSQVGVVFYYSVFGVFVFVVVFCIYLSHLFHETISCNNVFRFSFSTFFSLFIHL
jgi:hypothetical protein